MTYLASKRKTKGNNLTLGATVLRSFGNTVDFTALWKSQFEGEGSEREIKAENAQRYESTPNNEK